MNINQLKSNNNLISNEYPDLKVLFNYNERIVWSFMHSGPRPCYTPQLLSNLQNMLNEIKRYTGNEIDIEVEYVDSIELARSNKSRFVISDFQADFI